MSRRSLLTASAVAAGLAAAGAGAAVVGRRRWESAPDPTKGLPLLLPAGEERTVVAPDGTKLAVTTMSPAATGPAGRPIVLVHGWTADARMWAPVARRLVAAGRRVVVYDLRGHGRSTVGAAGTTIAALAEDLRAVLEAVDARDVVLGGHSMGGMTAQLLAIRHPDVVADRVACLVLISTAARRVVPVAAGVVSGVVGSGALAAAMGSPVLGPLLVRGVHGKNVSLVALDATRATVQTTPSEVRSGFMRAMADMDLTPELPAIRVPTLVVSGSRDYLALPVRSREIAGLIPGARLEVVNGAGHQLPFERPDTLAAILLAAPDPPPDVPEGSEGAPDPVGDPR